MFVSILVQELRFRLKKKWTHLYALLFFLLGFVTITATGVSNGSIYVGGRNITEVLNSALAVERLTFGFSFLGILLTAPFIGRAIYRDYESGIHPLTFTTPVSKFDYLGGRFVGAVLAHLYLYAGLTAGLLLAAYMPWIAPDSLGPFSVGVYLHPYLLYLLPNLLAVGGLFFALPALTRKMLPNYVLSVILFLGYPIAVALFVATENTWALLLDPFGLLPVRYLTESWSTAEMHAQLVPIEGWLLANRMLWMAVGAVALAVAYARFEFSHLPGGTVRRGDEGETRSLAEVSPTSLVHAVEIPRMELSETWRARWRQFRASTWRSLAYIFGDVYFIPVVVAALILFMTGALGNTGVYPVTAGVIGRMNLPEIVTTTLIAFYAGQLVWRERDLGAQQLYDTLPRPSTLPLFAKAAALSLLAGALMGFGVLVALGVQLVPGPADVDAGPVLFEFLVLRWIDLLPIVALGLAVHAVLNQKILANVLVVGWVMLKWPLRDWGVHNLYIFGSDPGVPYTDINGFGHFLAGFFWYKLLWVAVGIVLLVCARLAWVRGMETTLATRLKQARQRLSPRLYATVGAASIAALGAGTVIYANAVAWNPTQTGAEWQQQKAAYEKTYERFAAMPQPRVRAVDLSVDIYPNERDARLAGRYTLINDRSTPVDTLHLEIPSDLKVDSLSLPRQTETIRTDATHGVRWLRLPTPLAPGDTTSLTFALRAENDGFSADADVASIARNGTMMPGGEFLPSLGYDEGRELSERDDRREHGLGEDPSARPRSDTSARMRSVQARDAAWIDYKVTVGTRAGQTPLAPGVRDSTWTEDGRRYARFHAPAPALTSFTFASADYAVVERIWTPPDTMSGEIEPVDVRVYYHPEHDFNVDRMLDAATRSLDHNARHFGSYSSVQLRIVERPRGQSSSRGALGALFPSRQLFVSKQGAGGNAYRQVRGPRYQIASSVAGQWWGTQVASGSVSGAALLTEALPRYGGLRVMKEIRGRQRMRPFLKVKNEWYVDARPDQGKRPLIDATAGTWRTQQIAQEKGAHALYALQDSLGERTVTRVLRTFLAEHRFADPPFPTSEDLVRRLEAAAPDSSSKNFVRELFREVILYDNAAMGATYTPTGDGRYRVNLTIDAEKLRVDSTGAEASVPMNDLVEIGIFATDASLSADRQRVLYRKKHRLRSGEQTLTVTVDEKPARAGVDLYNLFLNKRPDDNLTTVTQLE